MKKFFLGLWGAVIATSNWWGPFVFAFAAAHPAVSGAIAAGAGLALHFTTPPPAATTAIAAQASKP